MSLSFMSKPKHKAQKKKKTEHNVPWVDAWPAFKLLGAVVALSVPWLAAWFAFSSLAPRLHLWSLG